MNGLRRSRTGTRLTRGTSLAVALAMAMIGGLASAGEQARTVVRLSEPVEVTAESETFGSPLPREGEVLRLATVLADGTQFLGRSIKLTARVSQVCQMKGCFFIATDGDYTARVSFRDYSFFVPSDISGRDVTLMGQLMTREVSVEQAEHYNADMNDSGALQPGQQYEIVATSVRVPII